MGKYRADIQDRKIGTKFGMLDPNKIYDLDETDETVVTLVESGILRRIDEIPTNEPKIYHRKKKKVPKEEPKEEDK